MGALDVGRRRASRASLSLPGCLEKSRPSSPASGLEFVAIFFDDKGEITEVVREEVEPGVRSAAAIWPSPPARSSSPAITPAAWSSGTWTQAMSAVGFGQGHHHQTADDRAPARHAPCPRSPGRLFIPQRQLQESQEKPFPGPTSILMTARSFAGPRGATGGGRRAFRSSSLAPVAAGGRPELVTVGEPHQCGLRSTVAADASSAWTGSRKARSRS